MRVHPISADSKTKHKRISTARFVPYNATKYNYDIRFPKK